MKERAPNGQVSTVFRLQVGRPKLEVAGSSGDGTVDSRALASEHHIMPMIPNSSKKE